MASFLSEYITPAPPFLAGYDSLNRSINDIWQKRQEDERVRIAARHQAAQAAIGFGTLGETERSNMATEAYNLAKLGRDRVNDLLEYRRKIGLAADARHRSEEAELRALGRYFDYELVPRAMAAPVAPETSAQEASAAPTSAIRRGPPPTPQAEPNAPKEAPPPQPSPATVQPPPGPAEQPFGSNPYGSSPGPQGPAWAAGSSPTAPAHAAAEAAAGAAAQAAEATGAVPPMPAPAIGPFGPGWAAMQWVSPSEQAPATPAPNAAQQRPAAPTTPAGAPSAGPSPGAATGPGSVGGAPTGVDSVTDRQWRDRGQLPDRGAGPDLQAIQDQETEIVRQAAERFSVYAKDQYELELAQNAGRLVAEASRFMPPEEAYKQVSTEFFKGLEANRGDKHSELNAMVRAEQAGRVEERLKNQAAETKTARDRAYELERQREERLKNQARKTEAHRQRQLDFAKGKDYVARNKKDLEDRGIKKDLTREQSLSTIESLLTDPNATDVGVALSGLGRAAGESSNMSNQDIDRLVGKENRAAWKSWWDTVNKAVAGNKPYMLADLRGTTHKLRVALNGRMRDDYRDHRNEVIRTAPTEEARDRMLAELRTAYAPFFFSNGEFELESRGWYLHRNDKAPAKGQRGPGMPALPLPPPELPMEGDAAEEEEDLGAGGQQGEPDLENMTDEEREALQKKGEDAVRGVAPGAFITD